MIKRLLGVVPLGLGALALAACSALLLANIALGALHRGSMKLTPSLTGVTSPEKAHWTLDSALNGSAQAVFARQIGTRMPLYPAAVRLRNQAEYSLFDVAAIPALIAGRDKMLFEVAYSQEYCARNIAAWRPGAQSWAADIRRMQDFTERRGKTFLYVLTPSKVAQYPGIIPPGYTCPASIADRVDFVPAWLAMLRAAGVHVADTITPVTAAHAQYPFTLYPTGGTHWNDVGADIAEQAIFAQLDRARPGEGFAPFQFAWHMQPHPTGRDIDIAQLMNLFVRAGDDPVPVTDLRFPPAPACKPLKIVIVGGSFSHTNGDVLSASPCHPDVTEYEYWRRTRLVWPDGKLTFSNQFDTAARDRDVMDADVLIYEENEQILTGPYHGQALWDFLKTQGAT